MLFYLSPSSKSCLIVSGPVNYRVLHHRPERYQNFGMVDWEEMRRNIFHSESQTFPPSITLCFFGFSIFQTYALLFPCLLQPLTTVSINFVNIFCQHYLQHFSIFDGICCFLYLHLTFMPLLMVKTSLVEQNRKQVFVPH